MVFAEIAPPPMNLLGPELVRDLVSLIRSTEGDDSSSVIVFKSADPDSFISHVVLTQVPEYRAGGEHFLARQPGLNHCAPRDTRPSCWDA